MSRKVWRSPGGFIPLGRRNRCFFQASLDIPGGRRHYKCYKSRLLNHPMSTFIFNPFRHPGGLAAGACLDPGAHPHCPVHVLDRLEFLCRPQKRAGQRPYHRGRGHDVLLDFHLSQRKGDRGRAGGAPGQARAPGDHLRRRDPWLDTRGQRHGGGAFFLGTALGSGCSGRQTGIPGSQCLPGDLHGRLDGGRLAG